MSEQKPERVNRWCESPVASAPTWGPPQDTPEIIPGAPVTTMTIHEDDARSIVKSACVP